MDVCGLFYRSVHDTQTIRLVPQTFYSQQQPPFQFLKIKLNSDQTHIPKMNQISCEIVKLENLGGALQNLTMTNHQGIRVDLVMPSGVAIRTILLMCPDLQEKIHKESCGGCDMFFKTTNDSSTSKILLLPPQTPTSSNLLCAQFHLGWL